MLDQEHYRHEANVTCIEPCQQKRGTVLCDQEQYRHEADTLAGCEVQDAEVDPGA